MKKAKGKPTDVSKVKEPEVLCQLGAVEFNEGKHAEAIELFNRAIDMDGENPNFYNLRAHALYASGEEKKARGDFLKAKKFKAKGKKKKGAS